MSRPPQVANIPGPITPARRPHTRFPANATDCHAHVFGPWPRYGVVEGAAYVPPDNVLDDYVTMLGTIGCGRGVLVQPSVYGIDNRAIVDAIAANVVPLRGIAVVAPDVSDRELERLHAAGFRGIRINIHSATRGLSLADAPSLAARIKPLGWHLQFYADLRANPEACDVIAKLPIDCVLDHFLKVPAAGGVESPAFRSLLDLLRHDHVWAKLMGPYFISDERGFGDTTPLARAMVKVAPDRLLWGTDWPHPGAREKMTDDGDLADLLAQWVPDESVRNRILVDNPARLYDFR